MISNGKHASSFRDPSGFVFNEEGVIKRAILPIYFKQYESLTHSGFYDTLIQNDLLIPHKEVDRNETQIVIQPDFVKFFTYPYEWSFNMYKEAALLTLKLQKYSMEQGYSLKDASAFNVTFHNGKAVFIDTLSFDFYQEDQPWRAYNQFIMHFLGPLLLAHYHGAESLKLMQNFMEGIPVKMIASLLPFKTKFNPFLYTNIHLLARYEEKHNEDYDGTQNISKLTKKGQLNIIKNLYDYIKKLSLRSTSEWGDYYDKTNYDSESRALHASPVWR